MIDAVIGFEGKLEYGVNICCKEISQAVADHRQSILKYRWYKFQIQQRVKISIRQVKQTKY
jgi:hypothetical protein